ncbi:MAG: MMPL family transporter [Spirochaetes bacterium]|nr:MMPL family transporter [Spirochaetota bacterium]
MIKDKPQQLEKIAENIFKKRSRILIGLGVLTLFLGYQATQLDIAADFSSMVPQGHEYVKAYNPYKNFFGGANQLQIEVSLKKYGTVLNADYLKLLRQITEDVMFVKGINRRKVNSLISPETKYTTLTEEGFDMGTVVPEVIPETEEGLAKIGDNIKIARLKGRMVSNDMKSTLITAEVHEIGVDYLSVYTQLNKIRKKYSGENLSIHIIGFAMVKGFVNDALPKILGLFALSVFITFLILWRYFRKVRFAIIPLIFSGASVLWSLGISHLIGMELDPMTTIVPFLVFAIGVSHGIQMVKRYVEECGNCDDGYNAATNSFAGLIIPGSAALGTDITGFITIMFIPIGAIQDLAVFASVGVACIILANLLAMTLTLSYFPKVVVCEEEDRMKDVWSFLFLNAISKLTYGDKAKKTIIISAILLLIGIVSTNAMKVGDINPGEPLLWKNSTYNKDAAKMMRDFMFGIDQLSIVVDSENEGPCKQPDLMKIVQDFELEMGKVPGVTFSMSPVFLAKVVNEFFHEGDIRWRELPQTPRELGLMLGHAGSTEDSEFMNMGCEFMNVRFFLSDHKGDTIREVIQKAKDYIASHPLPEGGKFKLAGGNAGVMAATNEEVTDAQWPMLIAVYFSIFIICYFSYKKVLSAILIMAPLVTVSVLSSAFMNAFGIGLNVNTLPVQALGVGIGVDYGIYIYSRLREEMLRSDNFEQAITRTLQSTGTAVLFTALTLCIGVLTWVFSDLKFQADMGLLLGFIFGANMFGAMILLPALVYVFRYEAK